MVSKKTLGDLGWVVTLDDGRFVHFAKDFDTLVIDRKGKTLYGVLGDTTLEEPVFHDMELSFAEIAAILDFIVEDAIY